MRPTFADNKNLDSTRAALASKFIMSAKAQGNDDPWPPGVQVFIRAAPTIPASRFYSPGLGIILQGSKRIELGNETYRCDGSQTILTSTDLPVLTQVTEASPKKPYCAVFLKIDIEAARELIVELELQGQERQPLGCAMASGPVTPELFSALDRLLALRDKPKDVAILGSLIHREVLYRLLTSQQGGRLREIVSNGTQSNRTAQAMTWMRQNYKKSVRMEALASMAGMGLSTFHHHFRAMSAMSPLQYQKRLRLHEARRLMMSEFLDIASAALEVGYESPTQFIREYARLFGQPPRRHIQSLLAK
jgi:AraC-like DNA-binding protein